jgi:Ca-activated chloride channel family protein
LLYLILTNKSRVERVFDKEVLKRLTLNQGMDKRLRVITLFIALMFMIIALARPVYEKGVIEVGTKSASLVIALDISRSMKAKDFYPDRLEFAKKKIEEFIKESKDLDIGLLAFAKDSFIVSPVTSDKKSLLYLLKRLDTKVLSMQGTNIISALMSAKLLFSNSKERNILLVTDGGDSKDFKSEIDFAKENGFKVFVLGVGTKKGAPIEENGNLLKDKKGDIVIVKLNENIKSLAEATKGVFVKATLSNLDIKKLLEAIKDFKMKKKVKKVVDKKELYPYPLTLAVIFLFLAFFDIKTKRVLIAIFLISSISHLKASIIDFKIIKNAKEAYERGAYKEAADEFKKVARSKQSPESYYDAANALYKAKRYKEAVSYYKKVVTKDRELEFKKLHNLGNSHFMLKNYDKAIEFYKKALEKREDKDTRFNLELAKKMKKRQKKSEKKRKKEKKQNNKNKNGKNKQKDSKKGKDNKKSKGGKQKQSSNQKPKEYKRAPISNREEKKWEKMLKKEPVRTLLYRAPIKKSKQEGKNENPW